MAVQQSRKSRSARDMCHSRDALEPGALSVEKSAGGVHLHHHISPDGFYHGHKAVDKGSDEQSLSAPIIAIDAMGGNFGPHYVVPASTVFLAENSYLQLILVGQSVLPEEPLLRYPSLDRQRPHVYVASEVIGSDRHPSQALRDKSDTPMRVAPEPVRDDRAYTCASAGNTGTLVALSRYLLKALPGIGRPATVTVVPTEKRHCHLPGLGANVDCSAEYLYQFTVTGAVAAEALGCASPRVAPFNVGIEGVKGSQQAKLAAGLLRKTQGLNLSGHIEGDGLYHGGTDVMVCDGFVDNILLKASEGLAAMVSVWIEQRFHGRLATRLTGVLTLSLLRRLCGDIAPACYNDASSLGLQGIVVKGHGSTAEEDFQDALHRAALEVRENLPQRLHGRLEHLLLQRVTGRSRQSSNTQFPAPVATGALSLTGKKPQGTYLASASLAFAFPGQGPQSLGILAELGTQQTLVHDTFTEASEALGYGLWALVQNGSGKHLDQTDKTQPAILTVLIAPWRLWLTPGGVRPVFVAGHNLSEYSALVAAESLAFVDTVKLAERRGQLIQQAVPAGQGGMTAVLGLEGADVLVTYAGAAQSEVVDAVNFNAPGQVMIAGAMAAAERVIEACKVCGTKHAVALPVSVPSHCELMRPTAKRFAASVESLQWQAPEIALIQNVSAAVPADLDTLRRNLPMQPCSPVHWVESIQLLVEKDVTELVECGPGKVLAGPNRRRAKGTNTHDLGGVKVLAVTRAALA